VYGLTMPLNQLFSCDLSAGAGVVSSEMTVEATRRIVVRAAWAAIDVIVLAIYLY